MRPDQGISYGLSPDGHQPPPLPQPPRSDSTPPMTRHLPIMRPRSATPSAPTTRPSLVGSVHIPAQMTMNNRGPSPLDLAPGQDAIMSMSHLGQHHVDSPSWSSATPNQAEGGMDYRMGLIIDHGLPRVDSPLRRLAQAQAAAVSTTDHRAPSASPRPPPTPTSAINIPMSMGFDHRPLAGSVPGHPPVQDTALNNMHSTSMVAGPDLELHQVDNGRYHAAAAALDLDRMMASPAPPQPTLVGLEGAPVPVSSYRRSTYPTIHPHQHLQHQQHHQQPQPLHHPLPPALPHLHSPVDMMHSGDRKSVV